MDEPHVHKYTNIELFRIVNVHPGYAGTAGDRALLFRRCGCGKGEAFEYGAYKAMQQLHKQLTK